MTLWRAWSQPAARTRIARPCYHLSGVVRCEGAEGRWRPRGGRVARSGVRALLYEGLEKRRVGREGGCAQHAMRWQRDMVHKIAYRRRMMSRPSPYAGRQHRRGSVHLNGFARACMVCQTGPRELLLRKPRCNGTYAERLGTSTSTTFCFIWTSSGRVHQSTTGALNSVWRENGSHLF